MSAPQNDADLVRQFHLGDLLTVTTGRLVGPSGMDGLQELLEWMTDGPVWTHQLDRAADVCKPHLLNRSPFLADIEVPDWPDLPRPAAEATVNAWVAEQVAAHGEMHEVTQLPPGAYSVGNPITELAEMVGPDRVIPVIVPEVRS